MGWVSRAILLMLEDGAQPSWLAAEGFVKGGRADTHILTAQLMPEWGEQAWYLNVDLTDAFGTIRYPRLGSCRRGSVWPAGDLLVATDTRDIQHLCSATWRGWLASRRDSVHPERCFRSGATSRDIPSAPAAKTSRWKHRCLFRRAPLQGQDRRGRAPGGSGVFKVLGCEAAFYQSGGEPKTRTQCLRARIVP